MPLSRASAMSSVAPASRSPAISATQSAATTSAFGFFDPHSDSTVKCRDSIRINARLRLVSIPNAPLETSTCRTPRRSSHRW